MSSHSTPSPVIDTLAALNSARAALHASRVEHATAIAQLDAARTKYLADSTAKHQTAVINLEADSRFAELRTAAKHAAFEAARAAHAAAEKAARLEALRARQADVSLATFDRAIAATISKHAALLSELDDVLSEENRLVAGYLSEQTSIARDAVALGAPVSPALDFERIVKSRLMASRGSEAGEVLAEVWKATAPAGVDSQAALAAVLGGVDAKKVASLRAKLLDSTGRAATCAKLVVCGHFESPRAAKSSTAVGRFNAALAEAYAARRELAELMPGADASVQPDALSSKIERVGAEKLHAKVLEIRGAAQATLPGWPDALELLKHRAKLAEKAASELSQWGFEDIALAHTQPVPSVAHNTITPQGGTSGFVEVTA